MVAAACGAEKGNGRTALADRPLLGFMLSWGFRLLWRG